MATKPRVNINLPVQMARLQSQFRGLNPNDLKLVTAVFVFAALVVPGLVRRARRPRV